MTRELTSKERSQFNLLYSFPKEPVEPVFESTDRVWYGGPDSHSIDPIYRLYNAGINGLITLKYDPKTDSWTKIDVEQIPNLYGFIWKFTEEHRTLKQLLSQKSKKETTPV